MTEEQTTETTEEQDVEPNVPPASDASETSHASTSEEGDETTEEDTFPREYVEKLRDENAKFRQRAQKSDELAHRLHEALVAADGRLADPTDLDYDAEHLDDAEALTAAIDDLLARKPHLGSRKPRGDIGQGAQTPSGSAVDLAGLLRAGAN